VKPNVVFFGEAAPLYRMMFKHLKELGPEDVLVVIGTDGAVIPIGSHAAELKCRKALNILEPVSRARWKPGMVSSAYFNHAFFGRAVDHAAELDAIVSGWMS
jgi:NAD-dependent deacetylase